MGIIAKTKTMTSVTTQRGTYPPHLQPITLHIFHICFAHHCEKAFSKYAITHTWTRQIPSRIQIHASPPPLNCKLHGLAFTHALLVTPAHVAPSLPFSWICGQARRSQQHS